MAAFPSFLKSLHLLLLFSAFAIFAEFANADPPFEFCPDANNETVNSLFQKNVNNLLSSLSLLSSVSKFVNKSTGNNLNKAYGLFLCINYASSEDCRNCITMAVQAITGLCPNSIDATVWEEECQLRFSDQSFFGHLNVSGNIAKYNPKLVSDPEGFRAVVNATLLEITKIAAYDPSVQMYATREVPFKETDNIYTLVQCTPDLSPNNCNSCLHAAIADVLASYQYRGGRLLSRSCYLRYEFYSFYEGKTEGSPSSGANESQMDDAAKAKETIFLHYDLDGQNNPLFCFSAVQAATGFFSDANKLGEGGFGAVYKGTLGDGTSVAVKRLLCSSEQGSEEFKNEVLLIMRLQHKNLVKLLGFCVGGEERLLVYELLPNKGLDYFLYDPSRRAELDWRRRLNIIKGIARGINYLHEDSRLRIVHRDLKPSNVLLDSEMNPKISDFGMARIWGGNEDEASTAFLVGTYGYMAPEYAMEGIYSTKTDVFSFGIILLEILTGRKSIGFHLSGDGASLQAYAWRLWSQDKGLELMDPLLIDDKCCSSDAFLRCIHIGLLCAQEEAIDRPTMSLVICMLKSEIADLSPPRRPAFFIGKFTDHYEKNSSFISCAKSLTVSDLSAR
ncbi:hypothetical protein Ancab_033578 [Ancistrocladus abbreviatus]